MDPGPQEVFLRPAQLSDISRMAVLNTQTYWNSQIYHHFLAPRAEEYPEDLTRIFRQKLRRRLLTPNNVTIVACQHVEPFDIVGFSQFTRLGRDFVAKEALVTIGSLKHFRLYILAYYFWLYDIVDNFLWKDRVTNFKNLKTSETWFAKDNEKYWEPYPDRENRWHANSVVVGPEWQGRGIGRLLMSEVLKWAQRDMVVVGLMSSPHGEYLYRKMGFDMLGEFHHNVANEKGGGVMIWYPDGWQEQLKRRPTQCDKLK